MASGKCLIRLIRCFQMKLVTKSTDVNYLHILKDLLEANGIPAVIKGENTARMITPFLMTEPSLWVYLEDQCANRVM